MHAPRPKLQPAASAAPIPGQQAACVAALAAVPACLILDAEARLLDASAGGHALLSANAEVLQLQGQRLRATQQPARLEQALAAARAHGRCPLALVRAQRLPLTLLCERRLPDDPDSGWHIHLRDPDTELPDTRLVQAMFKLTASEAAVAAALALGHSTSSIALSLGVQTNTVLAHVKKVLTKTGTQRQAQLVSLLLRSVAMVGVATPDAPVAAPGASSLRANHPPDCGGDTPQPHQACPFR